MVITVQLVHATEGPSQHAEHNELRNHTLNVKACYEGKGFLQTLTALYRVSRPLTPRSGFLCRVCAHCAVCQHA